MQIDHALQNEKTSLINILQQMDFDSWYPDVVVGIARGGLAPAVMISHALEIPMVPITWSTRDYIAKATDANSLIEGYRNVLVVDDIVDSGLTLDELQQTLGNDGQEIRYAALYLRHTSDVLPDYVGLDIKNDAWVEFSWELQGADLRQKATH